MFEKVLFPTDFSEFAQRMLGCITEIPGIKEIILLHIIDGTDESIHGWTHGPELENARLLMGERKELLEKQGLNITTFVEEIKVGTIYQRILSIAELNTVSLIVMGTHQKTRFDSLLHGSVSYDLLHHMNTHVLVLRQNAPERAGGIFPDEICPQIFSKVLVPLDFTENSYEMLALVREMHGNIGELVLQHVVTQGETEQEIEQGIAQAGKVLAEIQKDLEQEGFRITVHVRVGNVVEKIVTLADVENISLILMYAHKRNWIEKFLQDSTPSSVVHIAKKPVLVLRLG
jgi:nucleotide-binding universal stress UspA family protein